jgi:hypothetical protein
MANLDARASFAHALFDVPRNQMDSCLVTVASGVSRGQSPRLPDRLTINAMSLLT